MLDGLRGTRGVRRWVAGHADAGADHYANPGTYVHLNTRANPYANAGTYVHPDAGADGHSDAYEYPNAGAD